MDFDVDKCRFKPWDKVVRECTAEVFRDSPFEVHCLKDTLKKYSRVGGDPIRWFEKWLSDKGFSEGDRVAHEMRTLVEILYYGGCVDQLNLPSLICMEVAGHRLQSIVDAYAANPARPNWAMAKYYESSDRSVDIVSEPLKRFAARRAKEDWDLQTAHTRVRELRADGPGGGWEKPPSGNPDGGGGGGGKDRGGKAGGGKGDRGGGAKGAAAVPP